MMARRTTSSEPVSEALPDSVKIPTDPKVIEKMEAENGLRQYDAVVQLIQAHIRPEAKFSLRPSLLMKLNHLAVDGLEVHAGVPRPINVVIHGSTHDPPEWKQVPLLLEEMCEYVNSNWEVRTAIHLAAYLLWRINWIHPFANGNGRTARAISYAVLCIRLGFLLPGDNTIPEQIAANKDPYYECLDAADAAFHDGYVDVSAMEEYLSKLMASQLLDTYEQAGGISMDGKSTT